MNGPGLFIVDRAEIERLVASYTRDGWRVFRLPDTITSKDDFFEGVRQNLPLDPPLMSNRSWDALSDSVCEGIVSLEDKRILIVWPSVARMKALAPEAYSIAEQILAHVTSSLADDKATVGNTKQIRVLQVA